jgi:prevent-host-death family protein
MYILYMTSPAEISVTDARRDLANVIDRARLEHEPVYLVRHGQRVAAVVDAGDYDRLLELAEDMSETGEQPIPWESVKADLGLV